MTPRLGRKRGFLGSLGGSLVADSMLDGVPVASFTRQQSLFHIISILNDTQDPMDRLLCDVIHSLCSL